MAVGIIAAQSIGEPGTQLTMRTFHIGGVARRSVEESEIKAKKAGAIKLERVNAVDTDQGQRVALTRNGELLIMGPKDRILENYSVPNGSTLLVEEGQQVQPGQLLVKWDPHMIPILAEVGGKIRFDEVVEGETLRKERDPGGAERWVIAEHKGDLHPQIVIEDDRGQNLAFYYVPEKAHLEVREGQQATGGPLVDGPLVPHDILRISGIEAVQNYLVREVQSVYRSQRVDIDDKHIEIIVSQMLRKVKVESMGDTGLLPGSVIDKFAFREVNDRLRDCVKIKDAGDSKFETGKIVSKDAFEEVRAALEAEKNKP